MNTATKALRTTDAAAEHATMKAIVQHAYGTADVLELADIERPTIADGDVLIRVRAASVNHADGVYMTGEPLISRLAFGLRAPKQLVRGKDVAGVIVAVGAAVTRFAPGDAVYGELEAGSFAEFARAPQDAVSLKPANLTFEQAATVPLAGVTALRGLRDAGGLRAGQRVLINGASGGVGTFAVQIAKALGADVTGVASARNAELVRSLGAEHVIDYAAGDFTQTGERYDLIFDGIGNHPLRGLRRALTTRGTLVLSSGTGGRVFGPLGRLARALALSPFMTQRLGMFPSEQHAAQLTDVTRLIESGHLTPAIDRVYPLARTAEAIRYFAEQHARATVVISVSGEESGDPIVKATITPDA